MYQDSGLVCLFGVQTLKLAMQVWKGHLTKITCKKKIWNKDDCSTLTNKIKTHERLKKHANSLWQNICQPQPDKYIFIYDHLTVVWLLFGHFKKQGLPWKICPHFVLSY